ncbi:MAG TPA: hypothetical protein VN618_13710 [Solirubrobacteraceae bacterium]|nr:hypothetical protein [Solirubrobacteraceae bacterium]
MAVVSAGASYLSTGRRRLAAPAWKAPALLIGAVALAALAPATGAGAAAPSGHWCREGDPPLYASPDTSCELAGNVTTTYVNVCRELSRCPIRVAASPTSSTRYPITCTRRGGRYTGTVYCQGPAGTGIWTRFSAPV